MMPDTCCRAKRNDMDKNKQIDKLSREVLQYSANTIIVNMRFLDAALSRLLPVAHDEIKFGTDGRYLAYRPVYLLKRYAKDSNAVVHSYLHTLLHCIFRHNFVDSIIDRRLWDLSCDIAAESVVNTFEERFSNEYTRRFRQDKCKEIEDEVGVLTAERIYRYYCENRPDDVHLAALEKLFGEDDHRLWYMSDDEKRTLLPSGKSGDNESDNSSSDKSNSNHDTDNNDPDSSGNESISDPDADAGNSNPDSSSNQHNSNSGSGGDDSDIMSDDSLEPGCEADWKNISERIQVDMETLSKTQGDTAGSMLQKLREINRERYDYTEFLKKFAVMGEVMQVNDDEFDYVFYTYGLKLYKNMPLIEPLEYKEVKRIKEFVIAIDTSGSVSGEIVQTFLQKTYNIMKQTESFFSRINIHIIQCDAQIQEHVKISSQKEFDDYIRNMQIHGLGGTDFRPVFGFVDRLIAEKEFTNLKGLIYFTDGLGYFPQKKPDYETAFVFIKEDSYDPTVPPWAIKLILDKDEI